MCVWSQQLMMVATLKILSRNKRNLDPSTVNLSLIFKNGHSLNQHHVFVPECNFSNLFLWLWCGVHIVSWAKFLLVCLISFSPGLVPSFGKDRAWIVWWGNYSTKWFVARPGSPPRKYFDYQQTKNLKHDMHSATETRIASILKHGKMSKW